MSLPGSVRLRLVVAEDVPQVGAAVVAADFTVLAKTDMRHGIDGFPRLFGVIAVAVGVPAVVEELRGGRVQGKLTRPADEMAALREELAELPLAGVLGAPFAEYVVLFIVQTTPPLGV